ncbi:MAG: response regulator [Alphaproteobacteria bacterium]|nr:response regulator [Alphaproteobacteria bacterium]
MSSNGKVFVIDDDDVVRDSLKALLEIRGYDVVEFESGDQFLTSHADLSGSCLIVDVHMPGMTGLDLLAVLRQRREVTPAILITGRRDALIEVQAATLDNVELLDKPVAHDALFSMLKRMIAVGR